MNKLQYHSNEFFLLRDYPEEPIYTKISTAANIGSEAMNKVVHSLKIDEYNKGVKACIAAKTRIENIQELDNAYNLKGTWYWYATKKRLENPKLLKDGDIFDLPDNMEFKDSISETWYKGKLIKVVKVIHLKLKSNYLPKELLQEVLEVKEKTHNLKTELSNKGWPEDKISHLKEESR